MHILDFHSLVTHSQLAYVDPGSGSIALQLCLAAMLSMVYTLRTRISGIITKFRKKPRE